MLYEYECKCGKFQIECSIKEHQDSYKCPQCGLQCPQIISGGLGTVFPPKTLGAVAERNREQMGAYKRDSLDEPAKQKVEEQKKNAPWWRPNTTGVDKKLLNMTPKEQENYIENG